jgi:DNA (cytosine-5)-methyltransferase 1
MSDFEKNFFGMFNGGGLGSVGVRATGLDPIVLNEIEEDRAALLELNFQNAEIVKGDAEEEKETIIDIVESETEKRPFLMVATPPCQGMSSNGAGKLLREAKKGNRPDLDPRNRLILYALDVAEEIKPEWIMFENVHRMKNTVIEDHEGNIRNILEIVDDYLPDEYEGEAYKVQFADYGLPQRRTRLITVYTRNKEAKKHFRSGGRLIPTETHSKNGEEGKKEWKTLRDALEDFPELDAGNKEESQHDDMQWHRVPTLDDKKYRWVDNTPEGESAFDNQCVECGYNDNQEHGASVNENGVNRAHQDTPLYCEECGALLPRPYTEKKNGEKRIMKGYTSAYKRMEWDKPSPTITQNFAYPSSDNKLHPEENRVLSVAEAFELTSLNDYGYEWGPIEYNGRKYEEANITTIRDVLGEGVPPMIFEKFTNYFMALSRGEKPQVKDQTKLELFQ